MIKKRVINGNGKCYLHKRYLLCLMASQNRSSYSLLLLLVIVVVLPTSSISQPYKNVTLGSSLTATPRSADTNLSYWPSQSGVFAFGFLPWDAKGFLLAIWFNNIHDKTIVWSANRDKLAPSGSTIQFTTAGQLVLNDPGGNLIWTSTSFPSNHSASHVAMLDSGNFVLATTDSEILWQSFDWPTDTLLPSQTLNIGKSLVARYSEATYSSGRFQLWMQTDGNLVLYPREYPFDLDSRAYWASGTVGSGFQLVFNLSGSLYLVAENNTILTYSISNTLSAQNFYLRAILEYDGAFRLYAYPKTRNSSMPQAWSQVSDSVNVCTLADSGMGGGVCGFNSYCSLGRDQRAVCTCPPSYVLVDPDDEFKGCKPIFEAQSCNQSSHDTANFQFVALENTDWPPGDYGQFRPVNEEWCRNECLDDCFCAAAIFEDGECRKKRFPLSYGRMDPSAGGRALLKIRKQNSTFQPNNLLQQRGTKSRVAVIVSVLLGGSAFLNLLFFLLALLAVCRFRKRMRRSRDVTVDPFILGVNLRIFSYEELNKATSGFSEQLGCGSFATVYKGIIDSGDNNLVAVKKLDHAVQGEDREFKAEVGAIARTNHKNLVRLVGFCNEGEHRMLVYEFMKNGCVADYLFGDSKPNWYSRIQIVLGTARGLCYLHQECSTQTIHCDIKPQNILLDDSFTARIADFGLAKLLKKDQTRTLTAIRGTKGYVAPEWFRSLPITVKVDVYSFGILLLEIICCRRNFEGKAEDEDRMVLADWSYDCFRDGKMEMLVEDDEEAKVDLKRVKRFVMIAIWCIQEEPSLRPTMNKVVQMLEGAVEVPLPPDPSSFISTTF